MDSDSLGVLDKPEGMGSDMKTSKDTIVSVINMMVMNMGEDYSSEAIKGVKYVQS